MDRNQFRRRQIQIDQSDCVKLGFYFASACFHPPKKWRLRQAVWQASARRNSLCRDDFKLAVSDASSMKGVSTMQKEDLSFSFPRQEESRGKRRTRTILRPARPPSKRLVNGNTRFRRPRSPQQRLRCAQTARASSGPPRAVYFHRRAVSIKIQKPQEISRNHVEIRTSLEILVEIQKSVRKAFRNLVYIHVITARVGPFGPTLSQLVSDHESVETEMARPVNLPRMRILPREFLFR